jgi:hypothetical protein
LFRLTLFKGQVFRLSVPRRSDCEGRGDYVGPLAIRCLNSAAQRRVVARPFDKGGTRIAHETYMVDRALRCVLCLSTRVICTHALPNTVIACRDCGALFAYVADAATSTEAPGRLEIWLQPFTKSTQQ